MKTKLSVDFQICISVALIQRDMEYLCISPYLRISPYSVQMRESTDQKNSKYGHFSGSACFTYTGNHRIKQFKHVFRISSNAEEVLGFGFKGEQY